MSLRSQGRRLLDEPVLNLQWAMFILGKICLFSAVGLAHFAGENFTGAREIEVTTESLSEIRPQAQQNERTTFESYRVVINRNIFGAEEPKAVPTPTPKPKKTDLAFRLVGTYMQTGAEPYAIIEHEKKKEQDVFSLNENVFGEARLVRVLSDRVKLDRNGTIEELELAEDPNARRGGKTRDGVQSLNDEQTEFSVEESELEKALANLPRLLSQARAVPYFRNGKSVGMRLFAIRRGSLYEKLGLNNGDIIKAVNDNSLTDPAQALKLFEQLKNERSIEVTVERAGKNVDLSYTID